MAEMFEKIDIENFVSQLEKIANEIDKPEPTIEQGKTFYEFLKIVQQIKDFQNDIGLESSWEAVEETLFSKFPELNTAGGDFSSSNESKLTLALGKGVAKLTQHLCTHYSAYVVAVPTTLLAYEQQKANAIASDSNTLMLNANLLKEQQGERKVAAKEQANLLKQMELDMMGKREKVNSSKQKK